LGLDEFSMRAPSILPARSQILRLSRAELKVAAEQVLTMSSEKEVKKFVKGNYLDKEN
jgi:phosphoenolpyruvate-protein phosphotransferase (PTS system enzyme I)